MKYFLDTYAIIELYNGNKNYEKYRNAEAFTLKNNLAELFYYFIKTNNVKQGKIIVNMFSKLMRELPFNILIEAMQLRYKLRKRKLSIIDCLGYVYAKKNKLKFLTGDKEFRKMPNVEFVK
jgi:predicted nucleic acid-binding protein